MAALSLDVWPEAASGNLVGPAPADSLGHLLAAINDDFDAASGYLGQSVGQIESIVAALTAVASMFDDGVGAEAVEGLTQTAQSLLTIRALVDERTGEIQTMHGAARDLRTSASELLRCLQVIDIYGMNVKITGAGLPQFMEFADAMRVKLGQGDQEVRGLDHMLEALERGLRQMGQSDQRLAAECARVIPQVPDTLLREAGHLRAHHAGLTRLAQSISMTAQAIQGELFAAVQAIQIGDRVRQRLEHVQGGLNRLAAHIANGSAPSCVAGVVIGVLAAQCDAAGADYAMETGELVAALTRLQDECEHLAGLNTVPDGNDEATMLARIETGVAEAHDMLRQLDQVNTDGTATFGMILRAVDEVIQRAEAVTRLRLDVQHMAINIGLSCRAAERIGRPVTVIATEIRAYANRLDTITDAILGQQANLSGPCHRLQSQSAEQCHASGAVLARFIATISECSRSSKQAMEAADAQTEEMREALAAAAAKLKGATRLGLQIEELGKTLKRQADMPDHLDERAIGCLQTVLDDIARTYTMREERMVHDRCLPPQLVGIRSAAHAVPDPDDDDEDDGLF